MKKRLFAFALTALLLCSMLASCDMGNGLVGELLGDLDLDAVLDRFLGDEILGVVPEEDVLYHPDQGIGIETKVEETWVEEWTEGPWIEETWVEETWPVETEEWTTEIEWDTELPVDPIPSLQDVLVMDGDLGDWHTNNWLPYWSARYDKDNLDAWVGEVGNDGGFTMMVTCDTEYVYMAFDVNDTTIRYCENGTYQGDCFQIQLDLGGLCGQSGMYERGIFYSFGLQEDGSAQVTVQCITSDAAASVDYVMDSQDEALGGLKGATVVREDGSGWVAEIAIPWENLIFDLIAKLGINDLDDLKIDSDNVKAVMLVCYLDYDQDGMITGAWGTSNKMGSLATGEGWYPENGGITLWFDPGDMRVESFDIEDAIYYNVE
ncbi:MAG: hypothetical protein IJF08_08245 [Clostridia bacterium]|nr:hypothetical protein [Clostridia bacterium]